MALNFQNSAGDDELSATINTTPLVDVMLVLLIIFLITIPVVTHTVAVQLPKELSSQRSTKPQNVEISVTASGELFWNAQAIGSFQLLQQKLQALARSSPQAEVHVRGDAATRYEFVGRVLLACREASIRSVSFVTEPQGSGS